MKVKIAAAQIEIKANDFNTNLKKIEVFAKKAAQKKCDFFCIPEYSWTGPNCPENVADKFAKLAKKEASRIAKKYKFYFIAGTVVEHLKEISGNCLYNVCYVFDPSGKIIGHYDKRHPVPGLEKEITPGPVHKKIKTKYGLIGLQICRDILYSETTKITADMGAKIIFSPTFWSRSSNVFSSVIKEFHHNDEIFPIKYIPIARAIENEVIFILVNAAGKYKFKKRHDVMLGYTQINEPFIGQLDIYKNNKENLMVQIVETETVDKMRKGWKIRGH